MIKKSFLILMLIASSYLVGCAATVPMASIEEDSIRKQFKKPTQGYAGIYIYRDSSLGFALTKGVFINDVFLGETAAMTYFYKEVKPGSHKISTASEFSNNDLVINVEKGRNYFINQFIKLGLFVGGADLQQVSEATGMNGVRQCRLAKEAGTGGSVSSQ